jgi:hypothetical protein
MLEAALRATFYLFELKNSHMKIKVSVKFSGRFFEAFEKFVYASCWQKERQTFYWNSIMMYKAFFFHAYIWEYPSFLLIRNWFIFFFWKIVKIFRYLRKNFFFWKIYEMSTLFSTWCFILKIYLVLRIAPLQICDYLSKAYS